MTDAALILRTRAHPLISAKTGAWKRKTNWTKEVRRTKGGTRERDKRIRDRNVCVVVIIAKAAAAEAGVYL